MHVQVQTQQHSSTSTSTEKKAVGIVINFFGIGNSRKVNKNSIDVVGETAEKKTDKDWLRVSKQLIDADELDAINSLDGKIREYIEMKALPSNLKKGIYLVPLEFVEEVNAKLDDFTRQRIALVNALADAYTGLVDEARVRLGPLFDSADYLTPDYLRQRFRLTTQYASFDTPTALATISELLYEQERKKAEKAWEEAKVRIDDLLAVSFTEVVEHMVNILTPGKDGKKKIFKDSSVQYVNAFLENFNPKNLNNNQALKAQVDQAKALLKNVPTDRLRYSHHTREVVQTGFEKIKKAMSAMVIDKPARAISFE